MVRAWRRCATHGYMPTGTGTSLLITRISRTVVSRGPHRLHLPVRGHHQRRVAQGSTAASSLPERPPCCGSPAAAAGDTAEGPKRWRFPTHMLGIEAFVTQLKSRLTEAAHQQQRDSPARDPAAAWEGLKDSAIDIAKQLQHDLQQQQRAALRTLRQDLAAARAIAARLPSEGRSKPSSTGSRTCQHSRQRAWPARWRRRSPCGRCTVRPPRIGSIA